MFLQVRPDEEDLYLLYPGEYGPYQSPGPSVAVAAVRVTALGRVAERASRGLARMIPDRLPALLDDLYTPGAGKGYLDFGFGSVHSLGRAASLGWRPIGVDFSEIAVQRARDAGHSAFLVNEDWVSAAEGSISLARMNHVFEHLYEPRAVLERLARVLVPGGKLHVAVPNPRSLAWRVFRDRWFNADPRHVALYPQELLERLLREVGFVEVQICQEIVTKDVARSWGYVLEDRGRLAHDEIAALGVDPRRARLLRPFASLAAYAGRADRYHVVATR